MFMELAWKNHKQRICNSLMGKQPFSLKRSPCPCPFFCYYRDSRESDWSHEKWPDNTVHSPVLDVHVNTRNTHWGSCQTDQSFPDILKSDLLCIKAANPAVPSLPDPSLVESLLSGSWLHDLQLFTLKKQESRCGIQTIQKIKVHLNIFFLPLLNALLHLKRILNNSDWSSRWLKSCTSLLW